MKNVFGAHIYSALRNEYPDNYFHRAIRKYGKECFKIEKIDEAFSKQELNEKEKYWINFYDSFNNGYNTTKGGDGRRYLCWKNRRTNADNKKATFRIITTERTTERTTE